MDAFKETFSNLTVTVECTLEEFYYGCQKTISFERLNLQGDGKKQKIDIGKKTIYVKPGMGPQSELNFPGEGNIRPNQAPSTLVIKFKQTPHEKFRRFGDNLILDHQISLVDALNAGPLSFETLEGEKMEISIDSVITPDTFKVIPGKGMPKLNNDPLGPIKRDFGKGDLILKFDVQFPTDLNESKKNQLTSLLDEIAEENAIMV